MSEQTKPAMSVAELFAEREAQHRRDRAAAEQLQQKQREELDAFKKRLEEFQLTNERVQSVLTRIRRAFERGETELMITSFPSGFCTDDGRAIVNAGAPPINKPDQPASDEPAWLNMMPKGVRIVYDYWKEHLKPGGFKLSARILNYPGGKPGDVGLFLSWPK